MGMFYLGSVFAVQHGVFQLISGDHIVDHSLLSAGVLGLSFVLDAYVLTKAVSDVRKEKPPGISMFQFLKTHNDPVTQKRVHFVTKLIHFFFLQFLTTIIVEDTAATIGVAIAASGIAASHFTG
jgi:hypothetical protein